MCLFQDASTNDLLFKLQNGLLIAAFLNFVRSHAIDSRALHIPDKIDADSVDSETSQEPGECPAVTALSDKLRKENLALCASTCQGLGVPVARPAELVRLL